MRWIQIIATFEPECHKELSSKYSRFDELRDSCKDEVEEVLFKCQQGFCAYCETAFKSKVFIEHYHSQSNNRLQVLSFMNYLGVCSGKFYVDKMTGQHISHCGDRRGAQQLSLDPRNKEHIDQIYFDEDANIKSTNLSHNEDLNSTLNLNFEGLRKERQSSFIKAFDNIIAVQKIKREKKDVTISNAITAIQKNGAEFGSYILYRLKGI